MRKVKKKIYVADLFCGGGGTSTGMINAFIRHGINYSLIGVNHWQIAIDTNRMNHPEGKHYCSPVENIKPREAVPGGRLNFLWASPECTNHSVAKGGRPKDDQSRATAWDVLKWAQELYIDRIYIENVKEFLDWGPLNVKGEPLKSKKGDTFRAYVATLEAMGYTVDWQIMNAADFGAPTSRRRLIIQAVRGRNKIIWPEPTHALTPDNLFGQQQYVPAREIIDWSIPGTSIFSRKKPLAEKTLARIEAGIRKYWGEWAEPFIVIMRGKSVVRDVDSPVPTISCSGAHLGLVEPVIVDMSHPGEENDSRVYPVNKPLKTITCRNNMAVVEPIIIATGHTGSKNRSRSVNEPLSTVVTKAEHCLIEPLIIHQMTPGRTRTVEEPLPTITTANGHGLVRPFLVKYYGSGESVKGVDFPLDTLTTKERFALVDCDVYQLDIRFRMLQPHELAAAMSFPKNYKFAGTKTDAVKQIGNAVPPRLAEALIDSAISAA